MSELAFHLSCHLAVKSCPERFQHQPETLLLKDPNFRGWRRSCTEEPIQKLMTGVKLKQVADFRSLDYHNELECLLPPII